MQEIKRCLALDVGDKTIGMAISDLLGITAQGLDTIRRKSNKEDLTTLGNVIDTYDIKILIVGLPKNMNGTEGDRCQLVRDFTSKVSNLYPNLEIKFWDERLSTVAAEKSLIAADVNRKKRKKVIDKMAAVHILQGFLDGFNLRGEL